MFYVQQAADKHDLADLLVSGSSYGQSAASPGSTPRPVNTYAMKGETKLDTYGKLLITGSTKVDNSYENQLRKRLYFWLGYTCSLETAKKLRNESLI